MTTAIAVLTPVINLHNNSIVMLPLTSPIVVKQNKVFERKDLGCMAISGCDYDLLCQQLDLPCSDSDANKTYFINRCKEASKGSDNIISDKGYSGIFDAFTKDYRFDLEVLLLSLPTLVRSWREGTVKEVADMLNVELSGFDDRVSLETVITALSHCPNKHHHADYFIDGVQKILYSQG